MQSNPIKRNLVWAIGLTSSILVLEIIGGIISGSLALLADAGHVFMDVFAMGLSLGAIRLAEMPANGKKTFGWHRAEVFAAVINGSALIIIAFFILREAYERILSPREILPLHMMGVATVGLLVNIAVAWKLHKYDKHDLNVKSAYLHVISDMLGSVVVVIGGAAVFLTSIWIIDPILSIGLSGLIIFGALRILKEAINVLLEGVPSHIRLEEVQEKILSVTGVSHVHDLHVWSICSHITNLACHIEVQDEYRDKRDAIVSAIKSELARHYQITHTVIEVESAACSLEMVSQDLGHQAKATHHH